MVAAPEIPAIKAPGTADMDWENLGFEYRDGEHIIIACIDYLVHSDHWRSLEERHKIRLVLVRGS